MKSANAYSKNITTIQCSATGSAGAFTFTEDKDGSNNLEQIEAFDGVGDTSTAANYPAFYFAKDYSTTATNLGTDYAGGWYLPSIAELFQIYANGKGANKVFDINAASKALGGDSFESSNYWSSSQYPGFVGNDLPAYKIYFGDGYCDTITKDNASIYVCAIRAFN